MGPLSLYTSQCSVKCKRTVKLACSKSLENIGERGPGRGDAGGDPGGQAAYCRVLRGAGRGVDWRERQVECREETEETQRHGDQVWWNGQARGSV